MAIGPIEIQGSISRTQDYAQLRHNEENRGHTEQTVISQNNQREVESRLNTVRRSEDTSKGDGKSDAREKGSNEYHGDGGKDRNKKTVTTDGKVFVKGSSSSFDIKI